jgi:hypothetical protein
VTSVRSAGIGTGNDVMDGEHSGDEGVRLDKLAIGLSVLCLVHCLALPMALLLAPALGTVVLGTESPVHWVLLGLALPVSGYALWHGYRHHGQRNALLVGAVGLSIMLIAVSHLISSRLETLLTVVGVALLLIAHVLNIRHTARCAHAG